MNKQQLLKELNEASVKSSNCAATDYKPLRDVLAAYGFNVNGAQARMMHDELSNELEPAQAEPTWAEIKRANKSAKVAIKVGDAINYELPNGEARTGVVTGLYGKKYEVVRPDGSRDVASFKITLA